MALPTAQQSVDNGGYRYELIDGTWYRTLQRGPYVSPTADFSRQRIGAENEVNLSRSGVPFRMSQAQLQRQGWVNDYQNAYNEAKQANEQRYQEILAAYGDINESMEGYGEQQAADIRTQYAGLGAQVGQDMVSRGLTGTTVAPTMQAGVVRQEQSALARNAENVQQLKAGYELQRLGFMERRNDTYPDYGQMAQLFSAYGAGGGQSAGSGWRGNTLQL